MYSPPHTHTHTPQYQTGGITIRIGGTVLQPNGELSMSDGSEVFTQAPWVIAVIVIAIVLAIIALVAAIVVS